MIIITSKTKGSKKKAIEAYNAAEEKGEALWRKRERVEEIIHETASWDIVKDSSGQDRLKINKIHPKLMQEFHKANEAAHEQLDKAQELFKEAKREEGLA